jgi:hypothetical protein
MAAPAGAALGVRHDEDTPGATTLGTDRVVIGVSSVMTTVYAWGPGSGRCRDRAAVRFRAVNA